MKNATLDILMYLFDNYLNDGLEIEHEISVDELELAGFMPEDIRRAFTWLQQITDQLPQIEHVADQSPTAQRILNPMESQLLSSECHSFLLFLEKNRIINAEARELILDCVTTLESVDIDIDRFKRLILMVLLNQPGQESAAVWLEESIRDDQEECLQH